MKLIFLTCLLLVFMQFGTSQGKKCIPRAKKTGVPRCGMGKRTCLSRVKETVILWNQVTPTAFAAKWNPVPSAHCYFVQVSTDQTDFAFKTDSCFKGTVFKVTGLRPWQTYNIRVSAVDQYCQRGIEGQPAEIRTLWAPTAPTTTTRPRTYTPETKECGKKYFTCHSNKKECVRKRKWCDRVLNCDDGSDERSCPGGCKEINVEFSNGNYSCTRFGSPGSVCRFECKPPYKLDGSLFTQCRRNHRKWSKKVPICRLSFPRNVRILDDDSTSKSLTLQWEAVDGATKYEFLVIEKPLTEGDTDVMTKVVFVDASECCKTTITDLMPNMEYVITIKAMDDDDLEGLESLPAFGHTK